MKLFKNGAFPTNIVISRCLAIFVVALGLIVISGWLIHSPTLIQILPSFVPMQFNTALGFLLSGVSLLFTLHKNLRMAVMAGAAVFFTGGLTLLQYLYQIDLGIDQIFNQHYITTNTPFPGRMAANTSFCFLISGAALILTNASSRYYQVSILGAVITGLGLISVLGYLIGIETAYGWGALSQMAIHTSLGFICLGVGISLSVNNFGEDSNHVLHLSNILSIGTTLFVIVLTLWQALENRENNKLDEYLEEQLDNIHETKLIALVSHKDALERFAHRWVYSAKIPKDVWIADAQSYISDFHALQVIKRVDSSFTNDWVVPLTNNETILGASLASSEEQLKIITEAQVHRKTMLSTPMELIQGEYGLKIYIPLYVDENFDGFIVGVIGLQKFLDLIARKLTLDSEYQLTIHNDSVRLMTTVDSTLDLSESHETTSHFTYMNTQWQTELTPTKALVSRHKSFFPLLVLIFGSGMVILIIWLLNIRYREMLRTTQLEQEIEIRKSVQLDLSEKEELYSTTLANMFDAVILISDTGRILSFNKAAERIFGYLEKDVFEKNINILMPSPYHGEHDSYLRNYLDTGDAKIIGKGRDVRGLRANGSVFPMSLAISEVELKGKRFFTGVVRDITAQEITEKEKKKYTKKLERSNKELDDFAYVASHDLKAPLRGIKQLANWIQEELELPSGGQINEYLVLMNTRITRLEGLLDGLLSYSRLSRVHGQFQLINIDKTVKETFELISPPPGFRLVCDINLPDINTLTTPLELILRNLMNNAIKHHNGESGEITVTAIQSKNGYEFTVEDDGPGIPRQYQERIFGLFQTLRPRDEVEGSGMGLAMIKKILTNYQCSIDLESDGKRGSKFSFNWPTNELLRSYINE